MGHGGHAELAAQYLGEECIVRVARSRLAGACGELVEVAGARRIRIADDLGPRECERVVVHLIAQHVLGAHADPSRIDAFSVAVLGHCPT